MDEMWLRERKFRDELERRRADYENSSVGDEMWLREIKFRDELERRRADYENSSVGEWRDKVRSLEVELDKARRVNERDRCDVHDGVRKILGVLAGREWMCTSRGSYDCDDDRYQKEFGAAIEEIHKALEPLKVVAGDLSDCPGTQQGVLIARQTEEDLLAQLDAVMHSVDKWFDEDDSSLKENPATRAALAREIALREIEEESRSLRIVEKAGSVVLNILDMVGLFEKEICDGWDPTMYFTGSAHGDRLMRVNFLAQKRAILGDVESVIGKSTVAIKAEEDAGIDGQCSHGRTNRSQCPHCQGIGGPRFTPPAGEILPDLTSSTEGPVSKDFGEVIGIKDMKTDYRPMRGGWAPGNYVNKPCMVCGEKFIGNKRAVSCADCAYGGREMNFEKAEWMEGHVGILLKVPGDIDLRMVEQFVHEGRCFRVVGVAAAPKHSSTFSVLKVEEIREGFDGS